MFKIGPDIQKQTSYKFLNKWETILDTFFRKDIKTYFCTCSYRGFLCNGKALEGESLEDSILP